MTYRELDEAANRLAHLLAGHGVGPGQCVALLFSRSAEAIVAMLAVLKTGAAYLPIDPALPAARIEFMLADAAPIAAITTAELADRLDGFDAGGHRCRRPRYRQLNPAPRLPAPAPDDIAYLIYTSGTTGVPKGVAVTHRNVTQLLTSLDRLAAAGAGVDAVPFLWRSTSRCGRSGVRCCTVGGWWWCPSRWPAHRKTSTPCWSANRSACLTQTPSAVAVLSPQGLESVALVVGGEPCPAEVVDRWAPGRVMINAYGPTETTMCGVDQCAVDGGVGGAADRCRRCRGRRCSCWMSGCARCRPGWSVSCMWPVAGWALGIGAGPG